LACIVKGTKKETQKFLEKRATQNKKESTLKKEKGLRKIEQDTMSQNLFKGLEKILEKL